MDTDTDRRYRIVQSRDPRFDGCFIMAVRTTGIYCRPSCPATTPKARNVTFFPSAAAAQIGGYRACKRCRPDATPGSPDWAARSDVVARAVRLIAEGVIDRDGVRGLAERVGYSERQLHRLIVGELGAPPLALARSQRAQNARVLIEGSDMAMVDVAFAAGFSSVRQFNDTIRAVFDSSPRDLRAAAARRAGPARSAATSSSLAISLRLAHREPFAAHELWTFLGIRAVEGIEAVDGLAPTGSPDQIDWPASASAPVYRRSLRLHHGDAVAILTPDAGFVQASLRLADLRDMSAAVARCRRLLDLDADPVAVDAHLRTDARLAPLVARRRGLRCAGSVDGFEMGLRAILGQQVSVAASVNRLSRLVATHGSPLSVADDRLRLVMPTPSVVASLDPAALGVPMARARAVVRLAEACATGAITLGPDSDRAATRTALLGIGGIGPWTADYILMRGCGDPDVLMGGDLVVRSRWEALGGVPEELVAGASYWSPWRSSVTHHLWAADRDDARDAAGDAGRDAGYARRSVRPDRRKDDS